MEAVHAQGMEGDSGVVQLEQSATHAAASSRILLQRPRASHSARRLIGWEVVNVLIQTACITIRPMIDDKSRSEMAETATKALRNGLRSDSSTPIQLVVWWVYFNSYQPARHAEFNWIPHEARPGQSNISTGPTFSMSFPFQRAVRRAPDYTNEILVRAADGEAGSNLYFEIHSLPPSFLRVLRAQIF